MIGVCSSMPAASNSDCHSSTPGATKLSCGATRTALTYHITHVVALEEGREPRVGFVTVPTDLPGVSVLGCPAGSRGPEALACAAAERRAGATGLPRAGGFWSV
jgi:hypothetical protein